MADSKWIRRVFLFDLDGTLIDSSADIARSINRALARLNLPAIPPGRVSDFVGNGARKLVQRTLREVIGTEPGQERLNTATRLYLEEYGNHLLDSTVLYPGVPEMLDALWWASFGVVTNKPEGLSRRILDGLGVGDRFRVVLGGDSTPKHKPDPAPLLHAMQLCGAAPHESVMVGDSAVDVQAGKAAGMLTCGVVGGFRYREELEAAGCDLIVDDVSSLARYFQPPGRESSRDEDLKERGS
jgi:phosphoglycolate phosphatase